MSKNTQIGLRIPNELYEVLERERKRMCDEGEKATMTQVVVKYLYLGLNVDPSLIEGREKISNPLIPILERLINVLERLERKVS